MHLRIRFLAALLVIGSAWLLTSCALNELPREEPQSIKAGNTSTYPPAYRPPSSSYTNPTPPRY